MFVPLTPLEFRARAERLFGSKVGVIDGQERFTYAEVGDRSRRLAGALVSLGLKPGDVVSFLTHSTHHVLEAYSASSRPDACSIRSTSGCSPARSPTC